MKKKTYDTEPHAHFITFSCYKNRRLLSDDRAKQIIINTLKTQLETKNGKCVGFAIMPEHVHLVIWFSQPGNLSDFMKQVKRLSSYQIRKFYKFFKTEYSTVIDMEDPIWFHRYHDTNIYSETVLREKLEYMHMNPVKSSLVVKPEDWKYSSA